MLKLVEPDEKYLEQYKEAYLLSLEQIRLGNVKRHNLGLVNPDKHDVIRFHIDSRDESKIPSYCPTSYDYFAVDGNKFIGIVNIRVRLTESSSKTGGHIGYTVNPQYWRMGYGKKILKMALQYKDLIEEEEILMTCDDDNVGSYKIIEANGGQLENKVEDEDCGEKFLTRRYWIKK